MLANRVKVIICINCGVCITHVGLALTLIQWNLSKRATVLGRYLSKTVSLMYWPQIALKQYNLPLYIELPPLYKNQLELALRWLS